ncbi:AMP-binding protein [Hymenobacter rubripertinctus]|uniref:CoA ligase n=1 Tax=Hymenobacter rubripertinctus TaxID=2029981 RepID=A0A418QWQ2_9BACT|nr:AMP-binding protein [Hymenobacter rubripertinctus]RIY09564.1 CoA ligase [Hymenobacter rubripertinctus]
MDHCNLAEVLLYQPALENSRLAIVWQGQHLSRQWLQQRVLNVASNLASLKVTPDDRVLLLMHDSPYLIVSFLAMLAIGAIPVLLNPKISPENLRHLLLDSRARVVIVDDQEADRLTDVIERSSYVNLHITHGAADHWQVYNYKLRRFPLEWFLQDDALAYGFEFYPKKPTSIAFWQYTSGTTGPPKAVQHSQEVMLSSIRHFAQGVLQLGPDDRIYSVAKMFFGYGLGNSLFFPLATGAVVWLDAGWPTVQRIDADIQEFRPTVLFGVPKVYSLLSQYPEMLALPAWQQVRVFFSAGSYLTAELNQKWYALTGKYITDGIGTTEMGHVYLSNRPDAVTPGQTGLPVPGYEVKLVPAGPVPLAADVCRGELWVKPSFTPGTYWENEPTNQCKFQEGWYKTGDVFSRAEDGSYRYLGRNDDLFKINGRWVMPGEVEDLVIHHFEVEECALVGISGADGNTEAALFYSSKETIIGLEHLMQHLRPQLEGYKMPKHSFRLQEFPRNDNGKLLRAELVKLAEHYI